MNHREPDLSLTDGTQRLAAHATDCDACRSTPLPLNQLVSLLSTSAVHIDATSLSARTLTRLQPELERLRAVASWRRVLLVLLVSLLPLPIVVVYDAYFLTAVYDLVAVLLPTTVAAYLVLSYGALLVFLFALTYAAIPLLVIRGARPLSTPDNRFSTAS